MSTNDDLGGSFVITDEQQAWAEYGPVAYEHQLIYPGLMVPVWAKRLREECRAAGFDSFGRELLQYVSRLFPEPDGSVEEAYGVEQDGTPIDHQSPARRAEAERYRKGLETVRAVIAVLQLTGLGDTRPMRVLDVLETAGVRFPLAESRGRAALIRRAGV